MRAFATIACVFAIAGLVVVGAKANAGEETDKEASRALIRQGNAFLDKGKFEQALGKFEQAYQRFPSPKIFFNQAQALHGLGRNADAVTAYRRFIEEARDASPDLRAEAQRQVADLSSKIARIEVRSNREGASVRVDGKARGAWPLREPLVVEPGEHKVTMEWHGQDQSTTVACPAGATTLAEVTFAPQTGNIEVASNRPGAVVRLDDQEAGTTPLVAPLVVAPGAHKVTLTWQGETLSSGLLMTEGGHAALTLDFADHAAAVLSQPPPAPASQPWYRSHWVWVAGGVAVAAAATAAVLVYGRHDKYPGDTMGTQTIGN